MSRARCGERSGARRPAAGRRAAAAPHQPSPKPRAASRFRKSLAESPAALTLTEHRLHRGAAMVSRRLSALAAAIAATFTLSLVRADGPADNIPDSVRPVPAPGTKLPQEDIDQIKAGL